MVSGGRADSAAWVQYVNCDEQRDGDREAMASLVLIIKEVYLMIGETSGWPRIGGRKEKVGHAVHPLPCICTYI